MSASQVQEVRCDDMQLGCGYQHAQMQELVAAMEGREQWRCGRTKGWSTRRKIRCWLMFVKAFICLCNRECGILPSSLELLQFLVILKGKWDCMVSENQDLLLEVQGSRICLIVDTLPLALWDMYEKVSDSKVMWTSFLGVLFVSVMWLYVLVCL